MRPLLFLLATCVTAAMSGLPTSARQQPSGASDVRAAFLKLIDRPRVELAPIFGRASETDGIVAEEISFAAEAGQRIPTLLLKRHGGTTRRPAVIVLHGTGGSKAGMAPRLRELAGRGFVAVAIDGRYHGERATTIRGGMPAYQDAILRAYRTGRGRDYQLVQVASGATNNAFNI